MNMVPSVVIIDLKTGESTTKYVELTDEEYEKYERKILQPFAKRLYEYMKHDIETGKFKPNEISHK